jgi:hypothetical protein
MRPEEVADYNTGSKGDDGIGLGECQNPRTDSFGGLVNGNPHINHGDSD